MLFASVLLIGIFIIYFVQGKDTLVTVYKAGEDDITNSQHIFWLLKNNRLQPKYKAPIDWVSTMSFNKSPINITISVRRKNVEQARNLIMNFQIEKRRIERSIENERMKRM